MTEKLLTTAEACKILSITPAYLYQLTKRKDIAVVRIGKRGVRFEKSELVKWIEARRTGQ